MAEKITTIKEKECLIVKVELPLRSGKDPKVSYLASDIINIAQSMGHSVISVLQNTSVNNSDPNQCVGTWIFKLKEDDTTPEVIQETETMVEVVQEPTQKVKKQKKTKEEIDA